MSSTRDEPQKDKEQPDSLLARGLSGRRPLVQWAVLLLTSAVLSILLRAVHIPAAFLLGPMIAGIAVAVMRASIRVPRWSAMLAQGVVGGLIASRFTPKVLGGLGRAWKLDLLVTAGVVGASSLLGWSLARLRVLPGSTAIWGSAPGGATSMVVMAEESGADGRLVAFMQYLRVLLVALAASAVAHFAVPGASLSHAASMFGQFDLVRFGGTLVIVFGGAVLGRVSRIPSGAMLVPIFIGGVTNATGWLTLELPPWLLVASYALVGWMVGVRFTREILVYAARAAPRILAAIVVLLVICGLMGGALTLFAGIDPLTAYLATSPGGVDTAAIIASSSNKADPLFVMTLQLTRAITMLLLGPTLAKRVARSFADDEGVG
ncbi:MAG: AbrB family transcriptional regulator [Polyangiaceae bacterium]|nr:AbrB family transcriptional regulator [Polyangiaceae bacterium]